MERNNVSDSGSVLSKSKKFDVEFIKSTYNNRPNVYSGCPHGHKSGLQHTLSPAAVNLEVDIPISAQRRNLVDPALLAEAVEVMERLPHGSEEVICFDALNSKKASQPVEQSNALGLDGNLYRQHRTSNHSSLDSIGVGLPKTYQQTLPPISNSNESIRKLANQLVEPDEPSLVSRFKPQNDSAKLSGLRASHDNNSQAVAEELQTPFSVSRYSSRTVEPQNDSTKFVATEAKPTVFRERANQSADNRHNNSFGYGRNVSSSGVSLQNGSRSPSEISRQQMPRQHRGEVDLEAGPPMKHDISEVSVDIEIRERSRFYESQMELYVGFIGIQIIFIYANFVFSNFAGGILSLFTLIAACYSHLDRRAPSYLLTAVVMTIQLVLLCFAVSIGIHGFYPYRDDPTLKAISIGGIPLSIVFILLNLSLAYQHSYSIEHRLKKECPPSNCRRRDTEHIQAKG